MKNGSRNTTGTRDEAADTCCGSAPALSCYIRAMLLATETGQKNHSGPELFSETA